MSITSFYFLCLFALALLLYYLVPKKVQWPLLLLLSIGYFLTSAEVRDSHAWYLILYPMAAVGAVWGAAILIDRTKEQKKKLAALICAVLFCVGLLCTLKFFHLGLLAPMGISFYTLTLLGYLFDVYYEIGPVQRNYGKLLLFGCYFPTMISGPIMKYSDMEKQMYTGHKLDYRNVTFGMQRMILGFFKKLVISERTAILANEIFNNYEKYSGVSIWVGAAAFTMQLYTDFDGCMDIVLGISECFGIRLPENFSAPFLSRSIEEYWRRWHISLGDWLKNYLFYPLLRTKFFMNLPKKLKGKFGKKGAKQATTFLAMLILWFTIGYADILRVKRMVTEEERREYAGVIVEETKRLRSLSGKLMEPLFVKWRAFFHIEKEKKGFILFQRVRTFFLVMIGLVFFRSATVPDALRVLGRGVSGVGLQLFRDGVLSGLGLDWTELMILAVSILFSAWVTIHNQKEDMRVTLEKKPIWLRWIALYALLFYVILLGKYGPGYSASEFIYQNFKV